MNKKLLVLDGMRGIGAFYVLVGHSRMLLWEGFQEFNKHPQDYSLIDKGFMYLLSLSKWGHPFVLMFFVWSGYVIHMNYAKKLRQDHKAPIDILQYLFRRTRRIYPPFLFAIVLTAILDYVGALNGFPIYFGETIYPLVNNFGNRPHEVSTFFGNLVFLFEEHVPIFGTNRPSWSLKFEWWFYMLYPLFLLISRKNVYWSTALIVGLFFASFFPEYWPDPLARTVFASMVCWWLGLLVAEISAGRLPVTYMQFAVLSSIGFVALFFIKSGNVFHQNVLSELQSAFFFTGLLCMFLWMRDRDISLKYLEMAKPFGDFSYTLYIIHLPILAFASGALLKWNDGRLPSHSYFVLAGIVVCMVVSYLLHFLLEIPFIKSKPVVKKQVEAAQVAG